MVLGKAMDKFEEQILGDGGGLAVYRFKKVFFWQITIFEKK